MEDGQMPKTNDELEQEIKKLRARVNDISNANHRDISVLNRTVARAEAAATRAQDTASMLATVVKALQKQIKQLENKLKDF
jgi:polyhydroxyalkanoate synthesis regulator phasin